jgi:hypothetical protein
MVINLEKDQALPFPLTEFDSKRHFQSFCLKAVPVPPTFDILTERIFVWFKSACNQDLLFLQGKGVIALSFCSEVKDDIQRTDA